MVDFVNGFCDPEYYGGGNIIDAIKRTRILLQTARELKIPIAHTRVVYESDGSNKGIFCEKVPGLERLTENAYISQIVDDLTPEPNEYVVRKTQASAFFGTGLVSWLIARNIETLVITGCTTSGCVRASVVDSMSYNYRTIVVTDCVGDRAIGPHEANLFDMQQKYADLYSADEVISKLKEQNPKVLSGKQ
ncbi:MAG: isochorismatase family protein [Proteobacteria bacterium]|nr:isochorismatase family protein [Pseudomonadota bacterium]MBT5065348.1 isochorismatase family protein [Pseudomonadota bacterium]MBT6193910.1 isochorismatase family protein [Pseudomonadota bacterium]MBT6465880.1 isochorismatase family protein [Pseudomonadota bacterium]MBT7561937.1 isochorismatase family protein [Pseudomonadota bacterium]